MSELRMRLHFLLLLFFCRVFPSRTIPFPFKNPVVGVVSCRPHQIQAFTEFKNEFDTRACNHSDPFNGVWCDNSTGMVTKIQLKNCLIGTLKSNSSLFRLNHLRYLDLYGNNFISSPLPSEFGDLNMLEVLYLTSNGFLGQVPSSFNRLGLLSLLDLSHNKLTDLSHNHFSGTLNPNNSVFELYHLRYLRLSYNNFTSSLPSEFGNLNKLELLSLSSNGFVGQVPSTVSNLTRLIELSLDVNKLTGRFPLVQNLTYLSAIEIYENHFFGTIPSSLITMPYLSYLNLLENNFHGSFELLNSSTSSMLEFLYLGVNHFEGKILEPISKLINLQHLDLSFLSTSHPIDLSLLSSLESLSFLDLSGNSISLASLSSNSYIPLNLEILRLSQCGISEFPNIVKTLRELEYIELANNRIKGKIPEWLWSLPRLSSVVITNNLFDDFAGSTDIFVNSSVKNLDLQQNQFQGKIPNLPLSINSFAATDNRFTGSIPTSICNCRSLTHLALAYNNLSGPIPECLHNLTLLNLRKNDFEGSLPNMFSSGASLQSLDVGYNQLTGKLPRSLLNCSSLRFLSVDHNRIQDAFPFWLKALPNLQVLILSSNKFYGPISLPHQASLGFSELRIFEISDNKFTGNLSPNYFVNWKASSPMMNEDGGLYMTDLQKADGIMAHAYIDYIDLHYKGLSMEQARVITFYAAIDFSGNRFEGKIPESIGLLSALIALNLSNNAFTGQIPPSFANLGKLESLDLSSNQLSGTIPYGFKTLSFLAFMNVSYNQLKGEIPQGTQITGMPKSSFEGNAGLCGLPLEENCFGTNAPSTQQPQDEDEDEEEEQEQVLSWKGVAIGYVPGVLLGLAIAQVIASYKPEWLVKMVGLTKRKNR